ncbi:MAG: hypothetical protein PHH01_01155 [Patescibacteria group bacterium]|nr:hypothetical protein [Patescibacteria group bacterium]
MARQKCQLAEPLRGLLKQQALGIERHLASGQKQSGSITCPSYFSPARWRKLGNDQVRVLCRACGFGGTAALIDLK